MNYNIDRSIIWDKTNQTDICCSPKMMGTLTNWKTRAAKLFPLVRPVLINIGGRRISYLSHSVHTKFAWDYSHGAPTLHSRDFLFQIHVWRFTQLSLCKYFVAKTGRGINRNLSHKEEREEVSFISWSYSFYLIWLYAPTDEVSVSFHKLSPF